MFENSRNKFMLKNKHWSYFMFFSESDFFKNYFFKILSKLDITKKTNFVKVFICVQLLKQNLIITLIYRCYYYSFDIVITIRNSAGCVKQEQ